MSDTRFNEHIGAVIGLATELQAHPMDALAVLGCVYLEAARRAGMPDAAAAFAVTQLAADRPCPSRVLN